MAQYNLALLYEGGLGGQEDPALAVRWMQAAAQNGVAEAMTAMGLLAYNGRGMAQSNKVAADWLERAALAGDIEGQYLYAVALAEGAGRQRNLLEARLWASKAVALSENEPLEMREERADLLQIIDQMIASTEQHRQQMAQAPDTPKEPLYRPAIEQPQSPISQPPTPSPELSPELADPTPSNKMPRRHLRF